MMPPMSAGTEIEGSSVQQGSNCGPVMVHEFTDDQQAGWDRYVLEHNDGTVFHLTAWKRVVERAFGFQARYLVAKCNGVVQGVLPLFHVRNPIVGSTLISTPFAVAGGVIASGDAAAEALTARACEIAERERVEYLELREKQERNLPSFRTKELYVNFDKDLTPDIEKLFASLPRDTRYMIRKGQKASLKAEVGPQHLDVCHHIYAESVRNLGTPVFSKKYFHIIQEEFGDMVEVLAISLQNRPLAAVLSFRFKDWIVPYYGGSILEGRRYAANNFMYWELMRSAAERGCRHFDFGRSKIGTGAHFFKTQWSMKEVPLPYRFYLVRRKDMPNFSPANAKFRLAIEAWKRIPLPIAKLVGPPLVRLFP